MKIQNAFFAAGLISFALLFYACSSNEGEEFIREYNDVVTRWESKTKDTLSAIDYKKFQEQLEEYKNRGSELRDNNEFTDTQRDEFYKIHMKFVKMASVIIVKKDTVIQVSN